MKKNDRAKRTAMRGVLVALAMVLSWIESQFPLGALMFGMKLGLTNLVVVTALYKINEREAILINIVRIVLVSITFGNMAAFVYSIAGGMLSGFVMIALKRTKRCGMVTVSVMGGIFHNVGQMAVAMFVLRTNALIYYLAVLWIGGIIAGMVVGIISAQIVKRLPDMEW